MIAVLHRGGMLKRLQYYIGGEGSTETLKMHYVIYGRPLILLYFYNRQTAILGALKTVALPKEGGGV